MKRSTVCNVLTAAPGTALAATAATQTVAPDRTVLPIQEPKGPTYIPPYHRYFSVTTTAFAQPALSQEACE